MNQRTFPRGSTVGTVQSSNVDHGRGSPKYHTHYLFLEGLLQERLVAGPERGLSRGTSATEREGLEFGEEVLENRGRVSQLVPGVSLRTGFHPAHGLRNELQMTLA